MTVETKTEKIEKEEIEDDMKDIEVSEKDLDSDKLAALKAKMANKTGDKVEKSEPVVKRSIVMGVIGSGQAGSRISESFGKLGYTSLAINTAQQDLTHIELPEDHKLLMSHGLGGAGKELDIGYAAAEAHKEAIFKMVSRLHLGRFCQKVLSKRERQKWGFSSI